MGPSVKCVTRLVEEVCDIPMLKGSNLHRQSVTKKKGVSNPLKKREVFYGRPLVAAHARPLS